MANATFPFATLKVNKDKLELNASIVGNLTFQASDIISIEPYTMIPILGQGIKINHKVTNYKERVIFWTFKDPNSVIRQIKETGFLNNQNSSEQKINRAIIEKQAQGGFPIKKGFVIGVFTAIGLLFLTALFTLISADFRRLILKEGRELNDIKKFAIFAIIISGFILLQLGIITKFMN